VRQRWVNEFWLWIWENRRAVQTHQPILDLLAGFFYAKMLPTTSLKYPRHETERSINDFWHCSFENTRAGQRQQCSQQFHVLGSVPGPVPIRNRTVAKGLTTRKPRRLQLGRFYLQKPGISTSQVWLQLSIWVRIVSWHDQYVNCAFSCALSHPTFRIAIWPILVESQSKPRKFRLKCGGIW